MVPIIVLVFLSMIANPALGSTTARKLWDPAGVPISIAPGNQLRSAGISDGNGGAIIIWEDINRYPDDFYAAYHLYGQRINAKGECLWEADGAPLITVNPFAAQGNVAIISDGAGGAIFTFEDTRYIQGYIFAQRIDRNGQGQWQENGIPICTAIADNGGLNSAHAPQLTSDGEGGAIITWYEGRDGFHLSVYAQRVTANGTTLWALNGVPVAKGPFYASFPKIIGDGGGGAIIAWQDSRDDLTRIFAQRLNGNGEPQWPINGIPVSESIGQSGSLGFSMISDRFGGAVVTWVDRRIVDDADIYSQRINHDGQVQWQDGGVLICSHPGDQYSPVMSEDGAGGAIIVWEDGGATPPGSGQQWIMAQRINHLGECLWPINGIPIYNFQGFDPQIISDDSGGAIIVWHGSTLDYSLPAIRAQRVNGKGEPLWSHNGFEVYSGWGGYSGTSPKLISDEKGGAIIRWKDLRSDISFDLYAQRVTDKGSNACISLLLLD